MEEEAEITEVPPVHLPPSAWGSVAVQGLQFGEPHSLARFLATVPNPGRLSLTSCGLTDFDTSTLGAWLASGLASNLVELELRGNKFTAASAPMFANMVVAASPALLRLDLRFNAFGAGFAVLGQALAHSPGGCEVLCEAQFFATVRDEEEDLDALGPDHHPTEYVPEAATFLRLQAEAPIRRGLVAFVAAGRRQPAGPTTAAARFLAADGDTAVMRRVAGMLL